MNTTRAIVVDPSAPGRLAIREVAAPWTEIADVAQRLLARGFPGKAVLHVSSA